MRILRLEQLEDRCLLAVGSMNLLPHGPWPEGEEEIRREVSDNPPCFRLVDDAWEPCRQRQTAASGQPTIHKDQDKSSFSFFVDTGTTIPVHIPPFHASVGYDTAKSRASVSVEALVQGQVTIEGTVETSVVHTTLPGSVALDHSATGTIVINGSGTFNGVVNASAATTYRVEGMNISESAEAGGIFVMEGDFRLEIEVGTAHRSSQIDRMETISTSTTLISMSASRYGEADSREKGAARVLVDSINLPPVFLSLSAGDCRPEKVNGLTTEAGNALVYDFQGPAKLATASSANHQTVLGAGPDRIQWSDQVASGRLLTNSPNVLVQDGKITASARQGHRGTTSYAFPEDSGPHWEFVEARLRPPLLSETDEIMGNPEALEEILSSDIPEVH